MDDAIISQFLNSANGMVVIITTALVAMVKTFSIADGTFQRVRERQVKRLMQALRMSRLQEAASTNEGLIYQEALQQELFRLTLGIRATKQTREYISQMINFDTTIFRSIKTVSLTTFKTNKHGQLQIAYWPLIPLAVMGVCVLIAILPYVLLPTLLGEWGRIFGIHGPLFSLLYGVVTGAVAGYITRVTIKPLFDARKLNKQLSLHPIIVPVSSK